jgi:hypothetical protein
MDEGFIFGSSINIWDANENEKVKINIKMCTNLLVVHIYGPYGVENYIMVLMESMNEDCEQRKLFCPIPSVRYYTSAVGIEDFWPCKYLSMNDELVETTIEQCHVKMDGVNNLSKKQISCRDDPLVENFQVENISDVESMGNTVEDLFNEELHGEMSYIFEDGVEGSVRECETHSMNEEGSEENIVEGSEEVGGEENFEQIKRTITKGMHMGMMTQCMAMV